MKKIIIAIMLIALLSACDLIKPLPGKDSITIGEEGIGIDKIADNALEQIDQTVKDIEHFKETGKIEATSKTLKDPTKEVVLKTIKDATESGTASRSYENGQFSLQITAKLPIAKKGYFYEGWLTKENSLDLISVGKLTYETDNKYHLNFIVNNDYSTYNKVIITVEPDDENKSSADPLLEGKFTND